MRMLPTITGPGAMILCLGTTVLLVATRTRAADFCIDSSVWHDSTSPNTTTTVFYKGMVYDFLEDGSETTIFDPEKAAIVVLDHRNKSKTEVTIATINVFVARLRAQAKSHPTALVQFLADPKFMESVDEATGHLCLKSDWLDYEVATESVEKMEVLDQFIEFADEHAQLNAVLNPAGLPPFSRLTLNRALKERRQLPLSIRRIMKGQKPAQTVAIHAKHEFRWKPSASDLKHVAEARRQASSYMPLTLDEFRQQGSTTDK